MRIRSLPAGFRERWSVTRLRSSTALSSPYRTSQLHVDIGFQREGNAGGVLGNLQPERVIPWKSVGVSTGPRWKETGCPGVSVLPLVGGGASSFDVPLPP